MSQKTITPDFWDPFKTVLTANHFTFCIVACPSMTRQVNADSSVLKDGCGIFVQAFRRRKYVATINVNAFYQVSYALDNSSLVFICMLSGNTNHETCSGIVEFSVSCISTLSTNPAFRYFILLQKDQPIWPHHYNTCICSDVGGVSGILCGAASSHGGSYPDQAVQERVKLLQYAGILLLLLPASIGGLTLSINDLTTLVLYLT